ncbi:MAG: hypothetical protein IAG10_19240 [Planctomycetaceae bacterium]|nr:hypothetical protein [Planctomycetaceae bacterium]
MAEEFGISFADGPLEDTQFLQFRDSYLQWSDQRDDALRLYLQQTPKLFRVYLPYSNRILHTAFQIVWYFDEIIFRDPIATVLGEITEEVIKDPEALEQKKDEIRTLIESLSAVRAVIDQGYLLFGGPRLFPKLPELPQEKIESVLALPEVNSAIIDSIDWAYSRQLDSNSGATIHAYQGVLDSGKYFGIQANIPANQTARILMRFSGHRVEYSELRETLGHDPLAVTDFTAAFVQNLFRKAVSWSIKNVQRAHQFGSAVLFDRRLDEVILQHATEEIDHKRQDQTIGLFNLSLPFVRNIPVERLADLREQLPDAFRDLRGKLHDLVTSGRDDAQSEEELSERVESGIISQLRSIDSEMKAALSRAKILYCGIPIVTAIGSLVANRVGVDPRLLIGGATAAAVKILTETASKAQTISKLEGHPFYFLWKARQEEKTQS